MLSLKGITKTFGGLTALKNVSFNVGEGEIVGLIGPNGAGKTTLLNVITGVYKPDRGVIKFYEREITGLSAEQICNLGIGRTFQIAQSFPSLTVIENVLVGTLFGKRETAKDMKDAFRRALKTLESVGLSDKKDYPAKDLTVVELKRLELARALATQPKILLLDEVHTGLNPIEASHTMNLIRKIREGGIAILIVEHRMRIIMELCERVIVLDRGEKIAEGPPEEVASSALVIRTYLGEEYT